MWEYVKGSEADFKQFSDWVLFVWKHCEAETFHGSTTEDGWQHDKDYKIIAERRKVDNLQSRVNDASLQQAFDTVQRPAHYNQSAIQCIDAIAAATVNKKGIEATCVSNVIKYLWRYELKNGVQDVEKAKWYLEHLLKELSKNAD